jgi:hypothetical protein
VIHRIDAIREVKKMRVAGRWHAWPPWLVSSGSAVAASVTPELEFFGEAAAVAPHQQLHDAIIFSESLVTDYNPDVGQTVTPILGAFSKLNGANHTVGLVADRCV